MSLALVLLPCVLAAARGGDGSTRAAAQSLDGPVAPLLAAEDSPFRWGALLRVFYTKAPEEADVAGSVDDVSGFDFEDLDAYFVYSAADLFARVSFDLDQGDVELEDAHARWQALDWLALTVGQFKPRILISGSVPTSELLFRERTFLGAALDQWDKGLELGGHYDEFDYWLNVNDAENGSASDHFIGARLQWALVESAFDDREGARDAPNYLRALLGLTSFQDDVQGGGGWGGDFAMTFGPYAFHAEWADLDEEFSREIDVFDGFLMTLGDGHPYALSLSRRVGEGGEFAVRWQRADEVDSTDALGLCASWRPGGGAARLLADLELVDGDTRDFSVLSIGVELGSSGPMRPLAGE
jgi:hypothetical protein